MLTRTRRRALVALVPLAVVPLLVAATHGSKKLTALNCGDTITTSTTLSADVGPCGGTGVTIGADHVTLNLNGHSIIGTGNSVGVSSTRTGVVVENGSVTHFNFTVTLTGDSNRVINLRVSNSGVWGIGVQGRNDVVSGNRVFGNAADGIQGLGAGSQYTNNILQSNGFTGMTLSEGASVSGNKALNNGSRGIEFLNGDRASMTVTNNIANGNTSGGIVESITGDPTVVTLSGNKAYFNGQLGINAQPGVIDGGNNKADENGNSTQCVNIVCS
jgi:hypothetical protein